MAATIDIIGSGGVKHSAVFEETSVRKFELMKEDYVRLVFSTKEQFAVSLGDYIQIGSGFNEALQGRFEITKPQQPTFNATTGGYDYDLQFDAPHYKWNNKLFKFEPSTKRNEASWSLTDTLQNHMAVFLRNLAYYGWNYTVDPASYQMDSASRVIFIQYSNKYLLDALTQIAEAFECEWWITDNIIHFGKCESGTAIDFTIGQNVESMGSEKGEQEYITRLYGFGSTRNLPPDYRQNDEQVLLNGVVQKRVMLPVATPFVDIAEGLSTEEIVEGIVTFDDVYPRLDCHVTDLHTDIREVEDEDSEEEGAIISVPIYRFKDSSLTFSKDYILPGVQLQVQFQSGALNGMIFDLAFNPDDVAEDSADGQWFEIVRNDTYGLYLPNDTLLPAVNDSFVLLGWNVKKLETGLALITAAEREVLTRTREYAAKLQIDPNVYPCKMMADYMYGVRNGHQDPTATKVGTFPLGQRVRLNNDNFFAGGSRLSRVIGYEYKLDLPYDGAVIYVGESATYSSKKATQDAITEVSETINYKGGSYTGSGGGGGATIYIITTNDDSTPTDGNVYSALRTERQFTRKDQDDSVSALWTFNHGNGVKRGIQTRDYRTYGDSNEDNLFGKGFELVEKPDGNGGTKTRMEVDELFVRIKAFFAQLEIREMSYVGGNYAFSSAGSKIYYVEWLDALGNILPRVAGNVASIYKFRCYLYSDDGTTATMNKWAADDQALCETFNIDSGVHQNTSNKRYWRRVIGIGKGVIQGSGDTTQYQYVDISMSDCEASSAYPEAEDTIVQIGNWSNASRQGVIYLKVEGSGSPAIMEYSGVGANGQHFVLPSPTLLLSPTKNVIYGEFHSVVDEQGGNTGQGDTIEDQLAALIERLNDIQNQSDKKFDIWFGTGVPLPSVDNPTANANYPASEWTTEALKALHAQDIYYNTNREPAAQGGRAWRWIAIESNGVVAYRWDEILDADTLAALEKIADVASDGIITGGAEKTRVYIDWMKAVQEYYEYKERAEDYEITTEWATYRAAFLALGKMLNNNTDLVQNLDGTYQTPAWFADLQSETTIPSPVTYRQKWNDYYAALAVLLQTITKKAKDLADAAQQTADEAIQTLTEFASDGYLTPDEKLTVKREFIAAFHEMCDDTSHNRPAGILDQASDGNGGYIISSSIVNLYINAYKNVGKYLNGGTNWNIPSTEEIADADLPAWIKSANMTRTENISTDSARASWLSTWETFYSARTAVLTALTELAQSTADGAHDRIDDIVSDGVISAGSEKSLLYIDWLKTVDEYSKYISQATDYFGANYTKATALTTAYKKLAAMLNGQDPSANPLNVDAGILNGSTRPLWLNSTNINNDTVLSTATINGAAGTPDAYRTIWNNYHIALTDLLEAITKKAKELADAAQADATEALERLDDITTDGKLTLDELPLLRREFEAAYRERADMTDLATNDTTHKLIDSVLRSFLDNYLASFKSLVAYLQMGGNTWLEPATYSVTNGQGVADGEATYNVGVRVPLRNLDFPAMLNIVDVVTFQADWSNPTTAGDGGAQFRHLWADLKDKQVALANAMATLAKTNADNAQVTADDAQNKIADIVDDGKISGGSEKSQLYKEWMRTKEEYFDYYARANGYGFNGFNTKPNNSTEYGYYQDYLAFNNAFDALVLMMNGGTYGGGQSEVNKDHTNRTVLLYNGDQLAWLYNLQADTVIGNYSYTDNGSSVAYTAAKYRQLWNTYYYASVKLLNDFAEYSKALADEALHQLEEITDDGKITPAEKNTILLNWREVITEYPVIKAQADTYTNALASGDLKTSLQSAASAYILAFNTLATLLNGGTTYSYTFSPANFPTPSWLGTYFDRTEELTSQQKANFNAAWDGYYNTRTALQDIFVDVAKKSGDDALGELDNLAADVVLTPFEKLTVLREWDAAYAEYAKLTAQANKTHVGYTAYTNAFYRLGNYLYDKTDTTTDRHVTYSTMSGSILVADGDTAISGSLFKTLWSNYYKERSDLVAALATSHVSYFVGSSVPSAPYFVGDLWLKLSSGSSNVGSNVEANGEMMVCINDCTTAGQETEQDWANMKEITEKRDPRIILAALANMVYSYCGGYVQGKSSNQYMNIYLGSKPSSANAEGDMSYDGTNLWQWGSGSTWVSITNESVRMAFKAMYQITGEYTIRVFKYRPSFTARLYDLVCSRITFTDNQAPSGYQTVEGGIQIQMYNGSDWEVLQESTRSILENLPGYVRAVAIASANGVVNSSGFITSSDWATLFSQATDADGNIIAEAHLGTFITKVSDGNGGYKIESGVKIDADKVIFTGKTIDLSADQIAFTGKTIINNKFVVHSDGHLQLDYMEAKDVRINGIISSPFVVENSQYSYVWDGDNNGNLYYAAMSHDNLLYNSGSHYLYWLPECSGRLITLCHHESVTGSTTFDAPTVYSTNAPSTGSGEYLWARGVVKYANGLKRYTDPFRISNGSTVSSVTKQYYLSDSASSLTGGSWSSTAAVTDGKHIWVRCICYTYDGTVTSDAVLLSSALNDTRESVDIEFAKNNKTSAGPADMCFYEDGQKKKSITVSRQCVILKGYGTDTVFLGYIVVKRIDLAPISSYGMTAKCLAMGVIGSNSTQNGVVFGTANYVTFDGSKLTGSRVETGVYRINIPDQWRVLASKLQVMVASSGVIFGGTNPLYAGLQSIEEDANGIATSFTVQCGDDDSRNDGSVQFMLFNRADWETI